MLTIVAALLVMIAGGFEVSITDARSVGAYASRSIAFHAAEAALDTCERQLAERISFVMPKVSAAVSEPAIGRIPAALPASVTGVSSVEPTAWRLPGALDGPSAWRPFAAWPGAAAPPACLIERWSLASRPRWRAYLITARGTGATRTTTAWLQLQLAFDGDHQVARRWRRIAAPPS